MAAYFISSVKSNWLQSNVDFSSDGKKDKITGLLRQPVACAFSKDALTQVFCFHFQDLVHACCPWGCPGYLPWHPQISADQLTLYQPGGEANHAKQIILAPPWFLDLSRALQSSEEDMKQILSNVDTVAKCKASLHSRVPHPSCILDTIVTLNRVVSTNFHRGTIRKTMARKSWAKTSIGSKKLM